MTNQHPYATEPVPVWLNRFPDWVLFSDDSTTIATHAAAEGLPIPSNLQVAIERADRRQRAAIRNTK